MNTKTFCPCGGTSNLILGTGSEKEQIFVLEWLGGVGWVWWGVLWGGLWCRG